MSLGLIDMFLNTWQWEFFSAGIACLVLHINQIRVLGTLKDTKLHYTTEPRVYKTVAKQLKAIVLLLLLNK